MIVSFFHLLEITNDLPINFNVGMIFLYAVSVVAAVTRKSKNEISEINTTWQVARSVFGNIRYVGVYNDVEFKNRNAFTPDGVNQTGTEGRFLGYTKRTSSYYIFDCLVVSRCLEYYRRKNTLHENTQRALRIYV